MINRRAMLAAISGLAARPALGQARLKRIGLAFAELSPGYLIEFKRELRRLGWLEGETFELDIASAAGDPASLPQAVGKLVRRAPNVIVSSSNRTHFALRDATSTIPVVVVSAIDPVELGISASIARPTRNFTGSVGFIDALMAKRVEFLHEALPHARRIALHLDPANQAFAATARGARDAASRLGLSIIVAGYANRDEVVPALDQAKAQGADAVIIVPDAIALPLMPRITQRATALGLPTLAFDAPELERGFTFVLGADRALLWREAAQTVDKLLRGASVADIPFQQPTIVRIGVNQRAARALGVTVPQSILLRADEVIE